MKKYPVNGANARYINDHIPHISSLLTDNVQEVIDGSAPAANQYTAVHHMTGHARVLLGPAPHNSW